MEVANNVQKEETVLSLGFVLLDCARLKGAVVQHCTEWQGKLTALLRETASGRLRHLHAHLRDSACRSAAPSAWPHPQPPLTQPLDRALWSPIALPQPWPQPPLTLTPRLCLLVPH